MTLPKPLLSPHFWEHQDRLTRLLVLVGRLTAPTEAVVRTLVPREERRL